MNSGISNLALSDFSFGEVSTGSPWVTFSSGPSLLKDSIELSSG